MNENKTEMQENDGKKPTTEYPVENLVRLKKIAQKEIKYWQDNHGYTDNPPLDYWKGVDDAIDFIKGNLLKMENTSTT